MNTKPTNALSIFLADDDPVDRELFTEGMRETGTCFTITEAVNGQELLYCLSAAESLPNLIILDMNMPVKDGLQTLIELKTTDAYRHIPVVILSTSNAYFDVEGACRSGASLFLVKPHSFKEIVEMLDCLLTLCSKYMATGHA